MISLVLALAGAVGVDLALGDPPNRYHPVAWLGRIIGAAVPKLKANTTDAEKINGSIFAVALVILTGAAAFLAVYAGAFLAGVIGATIVSAIILKLTIAIRGMERHTLSIVGCLERGDLDGARKNLSMIVRRRTEDLSEQHVISATIECISESTVDGITGPLLYYSLLGPAGAAGYRAINTLDSMVGYKDKYFYSIGWMSARLDTATNYAPARITAFLMVVSARIIGADWTNSLRMLQRDHTNTFSPNAGYPMATMAGALRVRLEKVGHYSLGDNHEPVTIAKCRTALSIMKLTSILFAALVSLPLISVLYLAGWWRILLGIP